MTSLRHAATGDDEIIVDRVSVVVPVLDGESTLVELHRRLSSTLRQHAPDHEIVIVDDGSRDGTWKLIEKLSNEDDAVRGLRLARNSGHAAAVAAGFHASDGEIVAMIDVDLETYPEDIPLLLHEVAAGADLASGRRTASRRWYREMPSRIFNRRAARAGIPLHDVGCGMNAMRRRVAVEFVAAGHQRRSLVKPLLFAFSPEVVEVPVRSVRPDGSRLRAGDLLTLWLEFDAMHRRPPWGRLALVGLLFTAIAVAELVLGLVRWGDDGSWELLAVGIATGAAGVTIIALGLLAGMLITAARTQHEPYFRVVDLVGSTPESTAPPA